MWEETKLPCSIGMGQSYLIAKVASDMAKPRGLLWVPHGAEQAFLAPLPVRRIPGIGPVTEKVLYAMGVTTVGELAAAPEDQLREAFGAWGKGLYLKARAGQLKNFTGLDSPYEPPERAEIVIRTTELSAAQAAEHLAEQAMKGA